jgi:hypothetical protein
MYPVKVSANRRYFVDQKGEPVFWLGTTQWQLFREYKMEDAETIIERSRANGFVFAQVMLLGVGDGTQPNVYGETPWIDNNPLTPNDAYFRHVDAVVEAAGKKGLIISMTMYHQRYRPYITPEKASAWALWIGRRYRDAPNIVWSMTPEAKEEFIPVVRALAAGLREGDGGRHIMTFKPDPAPHGPGFLHDEPWLDFSAIQVWKWIETIYSMVTTEYNLKPTKPVLMGEGAYEEGSEYGFDVTALWIRRQAYYSFLAGAHHTYGHNDSWRVLPTWKKALDAPGAAQMGLLKKILTARKEWWYLVPDQAVLAVGGQTEGQILTLSARHKDGKWAIVYCGSAAAFSVNRAKLAGPIVNASWVDPRTAKSTPAGLIENTGVQSFTTPDGWEDALLVLETAD